VNKAVSRITVRRVRQASHGPIIPALIWLYIGFLLSICLFLYLASDRWWVATIILFGPRWVAFLPLPIPVYLAWRWQRRLLWPLAGAALIYAVFGMGFCLPVRSIWPAPSSKDDFHFKLMTLNAHRSITDPTRFAQVIADEQPDVILVQDYTSRLQNIFPQTVYPFQSRRNQELFIASRFPISSADDLLPQDVAEENFPYDDLPLVGRASRFDLQTPAQTIELVNVHLASPHNSFNDFLDFGATAMINQNIQRRLTESEFLRQNLGNSPSAILAGDFNTPPESYILRSFSANFVDAFSRAGFGFGYSYYNRHFQARIDHVMVNRGWTVEGCWTGPDVGSPHRPLIAVLRKKG
jgi:vancomycin resistance protein VanJ